MNTPVKNQPPLEQARLLMQDAGLPMPPVPKQIADQLHRPYNASYFTTRQSAPGPWDFMWFLQEVENETPDQYMVLGMDGHGVESAATHFYLVEDDLAIFHQSPLSSPSHPDIEDTLSDQYDLIAIMAVAITQAKGKGYLPDDGRVVIVRPGNQPSAWGIQPAPGKPVDWQETSDPLLDVCDWLNERIH